MGERLVSETEKKFSILNQEYNEFINELVAKAVEPPIERFQVKLLDKISESTKRLGDARQRLVEESVNVSQNVEQQMREVIQPFEEAKSGMLVALAEMRTTNAEIEQYAEDMSGIRQELAIFRSEFQSGFTLLEKHLQEVSNNIDQRIREAARLVVDEQHRETEELARYFSVQFDLLRKNVDKRLDSNQTYLANFKEKMEGGHKSLSASIDTSRFSLNQTFTTVSEKMVNRMLKDLGDLKARLQEHLGMLSSSLESRSQNLSHGIMESRTDFEQNLSKVKLEQESLKKYTRILLAISTVIGIFLIIIAVFLLK
jgi:hypothetical protein